MRNEFASVEEIAELIAGDSGGITDKKSYTGLATVHEFSSKGVYVIIDGEDEPSLKPRRRVGFYKPFVGDRVLIYRDIVVGNII